MAEATTIKKKPAPDRTLPIYKSEEIAAPALEARLRKAAKKHKIEIRTMIIRPPHTKGEAIAVSVELNVGGATEGVMQFLAAAGGRATFHNIPSLYISSDKKDSKLVRAQLVVEDWYAKRAASAPKRKQWEASLVPGLPALDVLAECSDHLKGRGTRITSFGVERDAVHIFGGADKLASARQFAASLFKDKELGAYKLNWVMRPRFDTERKDGSVVFQIAGKLEQAPAKKDDAESPEEDKG